MKANVKALLEECIVLLADSRVKIALIAVILNALAIVGLSKYGDIVAKAVTAGNVVAGLLIAGISYEKGKAAEGTVPAGQQSVFTPLVDPGKAADLLGTINTELGSPEVKEALGAAESSAGSIRMPNFPRSGGSGPRAAMVGLVLALSMLSMSGCAGLQSVGTALTGPPTLAATQPATQPTSNTQLLPTYQALLNDANTAISFAQALGILPAGSKTTSTVLGLQAAANDLTSAAASAQTNGFAAAQTEAQSSAAVQAIKNLLAHPAVVAAKAAKAKAG